MSAKAESLQDYTKIVIETEEKNPVTIAEVTANNFEIADGYRIRLTPKYDD
jgi:hypothetical protein